MHICNAICRRISKEYWDTRKGLIKQRVFWNDLGPHAQREWLEQDHAHTRHKLMGELLDTEHRGTWRRMVKWFGDLFSRSQKATYIQRAKDEKCPTCDQIWND